MNLPQTSRYKKYKNIKLIKLIKIIQIIQIIQIKKKLHKHKEIFFKIPTINVIKCIGKLIIGIKKIDIAALILTFLLFSIPIHCNFFRKISINFKPFNSSKFCIVLITIALLGFDTQYAA